MGAISAAKGVTQIDNGAEMAGPAQIMKLGDEISRLIGESVPTAADLPTTGALLNGAANWVGREVHVENEGRSRRWNGSGWVTGLEPVIPWTALPYAQGWADYANGFPVGEYMVDSTRTVFLRGQIRPRTGYANDEAAFVLPVAARPSGRMDMAGVNNGAATPTMAGVMVQTDGRVTIAPPGVPALSISGISYKAA